MIKKIYNDLKELQILIELQDINKAEDKLTEILKDFYNTIRDNTKCGACNNRVPYNESALLCEECRETFGHSLLEEL